VTVVRIREAGACDYAREPGKEPAATGVTLTKEE